MADTLHPRYRLDRALGAGGMGVVHVGVQSSAAGERAVAIKRLAGRAGMNGSARARLIAEARLVFQLTYANICQVLDLGENEDGTFVVMEYVRGDDLGGLLGRIEAGGQRLDAATAVYVGREVARALDYAHRRVDGHGRGRGIVHGDVKPPNILLSIEGEVKLADFGIARALGGASPGGGVVAGTPGFMAPEVRTGAFDHRADVYALGATLLRALLGRRADDSGAGLAALGAVPGVGADLRAIVARALEPDRAARWPSAAALEQALSTWLARHHPAFTPWVLAELVRRHPRAGDTRAKPDAATPAGTTSTFAMHTLLVGDASADDDDDDDAAPALNGGADPARTVTAAPPRRRRAVFALAGVALAAGVAVAASRVLATSPLPPITVTAPVDHDTRSREDVAPSRRGDDAPVAEAAPVADAAPPPPVARSHRRAAASAEALRAAARTRAAATAAPTEIGYLTVNAVPWGSVYVDGALVAAETPAYRVPVSAGQRVVVVRFGASRTPSPPRRIAIAPGQHRTLGFRE